jgi:pyridoxal phosphate enzyme (YggS family)
MNPDDIESRYREILERMHAALKKAARPIDSSQLVAVSKTHPPEAVQQLVHCGQTLFGESRVQEARAKIPLCPSKCQWHFIGRLQRNKIRQALPLFELFHGVESLETAFDMERIAAEDGHRPDILVEVNLARESSKFGFTEQALLELFERLLQLNRVTIRGLMCIPPPAVKPEDNRPYFARLRNLRDELEQRFDARLPELSMGMTGDFEVAIEEGAKMVRVGTAIFGERTGSQWRPPSEPE